MRIVNFGLLALFSTIRGLTAGEAPFEVRLQEEGAGLLYLYTETDLGREYAVEWSADLVASAWHAAQDRPAEGTGGTQAFFVGQRPEFDGAPPHHPARLDLTVRAYADGTSLAQWVAADGRVIGRRVALDFRRVPRQATAVTSTATVVTRTQTADEAPSNPLASTPDPDPEIQTTLDSLAEAYPLLAFAPPNGLVRSEVATPPLSTARFWRIRRIDADRDADGLADYQEWQVHDTNPRAQDSDGDGVSDSAEITAGTPPLDFFNAQRAKLVRLPSRWADVPSTGPNEWLAEPLVLEVRGPSDTPLVQAPVTVAASAGGLDLWSQPAASRVAQPVIAARTDAQGRLALAWRSDGVANRAVLVHAWTGTGLVYQGTHFTVHTVRSLPPPDPTVLAWLKADEGVNAAADGRVESWSDQARSVTATATGAQRPLLETNGPLPLLEFAGTNRLDLGTPRGGSSMSAIYVAQPSAVRTQTAVAASDPANRTPGLSGQRYLLAGEVTASASPWLYTPPVPRRLQTTQYFSRYVANFFTVDPVYNLRGYECRPISYTFGYLLPTLPTTQVPTVRFDVTAGALPDPGPANRQPNKTYRLNPNLPNCPLKAGASVSACLSDFVTRRGLPATYEWETRQLATYTRRAGNPQVDDFSEIYYETKGFSPEVPEKFELQPGAIGSVGQGLSAGTNSTGYFHLSQHFAPSLGNAVAGPAGLSLTSVVISNGRPAFFTNGAPAGTSVAPAGGSAGGFRHIGALAGNTNGFSGTVGDIILTSGAMTEDSRRALEDVVADRRRLTRVDRDADTMPDWWERRCLTAGPAAIPTANPDNDGLTNAQERARFTLPEWADSDLDGLNDGAEAVAAAIIADSDNDGLLDGADPSPNDPANGQADTNGDGIPDGLAALLATPDQRDSDSDSLSDLTESMVTRTNPRTADTDDDTLPDGWESTFDLDPNDPSGEQGPNGDPDGDGKSNAQERALGTNPRVPD